MLNHRRGRAIGAIPFTWGVNHKPKSSRHETFFVCGFCKKVVFNKTTAEHYLVECNRMNYKARHLSRRENQRIKALKREVE